MYTTYLCIMIPHIYLYEGHHFTFPTKHKLPGQFHPPQAPPPILSIDLLDLWRLVRPFVKNGHEEEGRPGGCFFLVPLRIPRLGPIQNGKGAWIAGVWVWVQPNELTSWGVRGFLGLEKKEAARFGGVLLKKRFGGLFFGRFGSFTSSSGELFNGQVFFVKEVCCF